MQFVLLDSQDKSTYADGRETKEVRKMRPSLWVAWVVDNFRGGQNACGLGTMGVCLDVVKDKGGTLAVAWVAVVFLVILSK